MGILTNALNQLVQGTIGLGIGQLDDYFTRLVESGQQEQAAQEAFKLDQELAQRGFMQDSLLSGQFNMPGMDLGGASAIDPNSAQGKGVLSSLATLPYIDPVINKSPTHSQLAVQRGTQFIQNNPLVQQREQTQKAQEERRGLVKSMIGEGYKQNQMGFQEGLGAFDDPAGYDLSRQERISRSAERTGALEAAKGPEWDRRQGRRVADQIRVKQTKGAGSGGGGGGGGGDGADAIVSSATAEEITKIQKQLMLYPEYVETGLDGKPKLNQAGQNAAYKAAGVLQTQKKKNFLRAAKEGRDAERKEFKEQEKQTSTPEGRLDFLRNRATTPEAQQRLQEVEQQLKEGQQAPSAPTATQQTPQEKAAQLTDQDRKDIERMKKPVSEGGLGWDDEQVNKFLRDAGKIK